MDYHGLSWTIMDYHELAWTIFTTWVLMDGWMDGQTLVLVKSISQLKKTFI